MSLSRSLVLVRGVIGRVPLVPLLPLLVPSVPSLVLMLESSLVRFCLMLEPEHVQHWGNHWCDDLAINLHQPAQALPLLSFALLALFPLLPLSLASPLPPGVVQPPAHAARGELSGTSLHHAGLLWSATLLLVLLLPLLLLRLLQCLLMLLLLLLLLLPLP